MISSARPLLARGPRLVPDLPKGWAGLGSNTNLPSFGLETTNQSIVDRETESQTDQQAVSII